MEASSTTTKSVAKMGAGLAAASGLYCNNWCKVTACEGMPSAQPSGKPAKAD